MKTIEIWKYAKGVSKVYTEVYEIKQQLVKDLKLQVCNLYENPKGWDFIVGNDLLRRIDKVVKNIEKDLLAQNKD